MRFFLLPISNRRTLLYCQRLNILTTEKSSLVDRFTQRATKTWADWEKKEAGWQKKVVEYGNYAFRRIPYEEWGLKSVPPLSKRRQSEELQGPGKVDLVFPESIIAKDQAESILQKLGTEREAIHKRKLLWCLVGMPITIPFALVPVIPNLPFFYLAYRAWSHWRALSGGRHIQFLLANKLVSPTPSPILDQIYRRLALTAPPKPAVKATDPDAEPEPQVSGTVEEERIILEPASGKLLAQALEFPDLETEIDRAIWQVEMGLKKARGKQEKEHRRQRSDTDQSLTTSDATTNGLNAAEKEETKKTK